jgi:glycosyltransferase involved in cell wall biosynthesis
LVTVKHRMNAVMDLVTKETGLICEPSEDDLAAAIIEELGKWKDMRVSCVDFARGYDWENICNNLEKVYRA